MAWESTSWVGQLAGLLGLCRGIVRHVRGSVCKYGLLSLSRSTRGDHRRTGDCKPFTHKIRDRCIYHLKHVLSCTQGPDKYANGRLASSYNQSVCYICKCSILASFCVLIYRKCCQGIPVQSLGRDQGLSAGDAHTHILTHTHSSAFSPPITFTVNPTSFLV